VRHRRKSILASSSFPDVECLREGLTKRRGIGGYGESPAGIVLSTGFGKEGGKARIKQGDASEKELKRGEKFGAINPLRIV